LDLNNYQYKLLSNVEKINDTFNIHGANKSVANQM